MEEERDPLQALFDQHPIPWIAEDNREGHEGSVITFDAVGNTVIYAGDMEDCTMADILLAHAVAAIPKMYELAALVAADYEDAADWKDARGKLAALASEIMSMVKGD